MPERLRITRKIARLVRIMYAVHLMRVGVKGDYHVTNRELAEGSKISMPTFYTLIDQLESAGWVERELEVLPEGVTGPRKTFFHLTDTGVDLARRAVIQDARRFAVGTWIRKALR